MVQLKKHIHNATTFNSILMIKLKTYLKAPEQPQPENPCLPPQDSRWQLVWPPQLSASLPQGPQELGVELLQ